MHRSVLIVGVLLLSFIPFLACQQGGIKDGVQTPFQPKKGIENNGLGEMMWLAPIEDATSIMQKTAGIKASRPSEPADNYFVIRKDLLGTDLLFAPTIVNYPIMEDEKEILPIFTPMSLNSKIVYFQVVGDKVYLFENMKGKDISQPYEHENIVAEFSMIKEDEETITFDFKSGFDRLIMFNDFPTDVGGSYVRNYENKGDNFFAVYHVAQIGSGTFTFSYAFMPADSQLDRIAPDAEHKVGFFDTDPLYETVTGEKTKSITRIDIGKPFIFYLSANTPAEYRNAIKEGALAWNDVFGKEALEVSDAPEGLLAGAPLNSVIQWVESDVMGFAYSNSSHHPITGETIRSNIIFPSMWAVNSRKSAEVLLEKSKNKNQPESVKKQNKFIGLSGFDRREQCRFSTDSSWFNFVSKVANGEISDENTLKLSQMMIRAIIMHEVGHTIGLRHNFAGNLGSEIAISDEDTQLGNFLNTFTSSKLPSSSIMDYPIFEDIVRMYSPGAYDRAAIKWGYFASKGVQDDMEFPLFCSDEDVTTNADCAKGDSGRDPIKWRAEKIKEKLATIGLQIKEGKKEVFSFSSKYITELLNYLNGQMAVYDMPWGGQLKRRTEVAEIFVSYLKPSYDNYEAIAKLAGIINQGTLEGLSDDELRKLLEAAYRTRKELLQQILSGMVYVKDGSREGDNEDAEIKVFSLYNDEAITVPVAIVVADIVANHLEVGLSAEPFEIRQLAANLLISYNYKPFLTAKKSAIDRLNEEISLIQEAAKSAIGEAAEKLQTALEEEQTLVSMLEGAGQR